MHIYLHVRMYVCMQLSTYEHHARLIVVNHKLYMYNYFYKSVMKCVFD